jgi:hypothetical protein
MTLIATIHRVEGGESPIGFRDEINVGLYAPDFTEVCTGIRRFHHRIDLVDHWRPREEAATYGTER